jgi:hypothetical protein
LPFAVGETLSVRDCRYGGRERAGACAHTSAIVGDDLKADAGAGHSAGSVSHCCRETAREYRARKRDLAIAAGDSDADKISERRKQAAAIGVATPRPVSESHQGERSEVLLSPVTQFEDWA